MTQEDKELLLKDLSARLPYGVKCHFKYGKAEGDIILKCIDGNVARFDYGWYGKFHVIIDPQYIKPYLRPLSSMTEEEFSEYHNIKYNKVTYRNNWQRINVGKFHNVGIIPIEDYLDWLNSYYFDYRGLIDKGLAIEVSEKNNPYEFKSRR